VGPLVSTDWLAARLGAPGLRVIDGSWYLPNSGRDAHSEYLAEHIPGAIFFDLDASSNNQNPLPHMLPAEQAFAARVESLGINDGDDLVVYDGSGNNLSAARVWWMFRVFGHSRVAVLDGGLGKWRREQRPLEAGPVTLPPGRFRARLEGERVRDLADLRSNIDSRRELVVDLRPAGRYAGIQPEPRPGIRGGHIPGSKNLPFTELVASDGTILPVEQLRRHLHQRGVELSQPIIATCGSGTSACALVLALDLLGFSDVAVYDGAWTEWGGRDDTPIESAS
jgi:thiosulfate/3-mercaptopyruvate sulfurtransferase